MWLGLTSASHQRDVDRNLNFAREQSRLTGFEVARDYGLRLRALIE